jgi:chemotaxis signal transduction protein
MTSDEMAESLESLPEDGLQAGDAQEERESYYIFAVGESRFALPPSAIREIVSDQEVFPLPACPPCVSGLINCHGTPHTVFDLKVLFENERQAATKFLVLNLEADDAALGCTEVVEIAQVPRSAISSFSDKDAEARFCSATIELEGRRIPVLSFDLIQRQLENDLA